MQRVNIKCTPFGNFNIAPGANATPIPINYANGPMRWDADIRFTRTGAGVRSAMSRSPHGRWWRSADLVAVVPPPGGGGGGGAAAAVAVVALAAVVADVAADSVRWAAATSHRYNVGADDRRRPISSTT